jgi:tRNA pseudouridine synthase 10
MVRDKVVHSLHITPARDKEPYDRLIIRMETSAGTYVKEFCHGDGGRTVPSLKDLFEMDVEVQVVRLDVLEVDLDWPPTVDDLDLDE